MIGGLSVATPIGVLLSLLAGAVLCAQPLTPGGLNEKPMQDKTIEAVLKEYTDRLMSLPGVVGTAEGRCAGKPCIKVYVSKNTADLRRQIPSDIEGFPVAVEETGEIRARDSD